MSDDLALRVRDVWKGYGGAPVLRGIDLDLAWGEVLTLFGANGAGKTTLLRMLATVARPDKGEIQIGGRDTHKKGEAARRLIGVVEHRPMLYRNMTVRENLVFFGRFYGIPKPEARTIEVVQMVGLEPRLDQRVGQLSHGLQKRAAIARALLHNPPVLLLDEPETGLDAESVKYLEKVIRPDQGPRRAVVMTTHSVERGIAIADKVAVLDKGRVALSEATSNKTASLLQAVSVYLEGRA